MKVTLSFLRYMVLLILCFFYLNYSNAQSKMYLYYFNANLEIVPKENAIIMAKGIQQDTSFVMLYYSILGNQLYLLERYKDSTLQTMNGQRVLYHNNKKVAEIYNFRDNLLDGSYAIMDTSGHTVDSGFYKNDKKIFSTKKYYNSNQNVNRVVTNDSLNNTLKDIVFDGAGKKIIEVNFKGNKGLWTEFRPDGSVLLSDSVFTRDETESVFSLDKNAWRKFLEKHLDGGVLIKNGAIGGNGQVITKFVISEDGSLENIHALTKVGYGAEEEAIRVLKRSPKWVPATRYGKKIKAYRTQPITFFVQ